MDVLIKYGFTIEEIKIIMDSNYDFDMIKDKDINEFLSYLNENSLKKELEIYDHLESELL